MRSESVKCRCSGDAIVAPKQTSLVTPAVKTPCLATKELIEALVELLLKIALRRGLHGLRAELSGDRLNALGIKTRSGDGAVDGKCDDLSGEPL